MNYDAVFSGDYRFFYEPLATSHRSDYDAGLLMNAFQAAPPGPILDVGCGDGRLVRRLRATGRQIIGVDRSESMIDAAKEHDPEHGQDYKFGDLRQLDMQSVFAGAFSWFTSFGYESDDENRAILSAIVDALVPGGIFIIDVINRDFIIKNFREVIVVERGDCFMIDQNKYCTRKNQIHTSRAYIREGVRRSQFSVRLFGLPELSDWLRTAGLVDVHVPAYAADKDTVPETRIILMGRKL